MARTRWYYMLMTSLPALPPLFTTSQTPMSRLRLEKRLSLLDEKDAAELSHIEDVMHWDRFPLDMDDSAIVAQAREVIPHVRSGTLRGVVNTRMERRTVVAALRRRALGGARPEPGEVWGYGRWVPRIVRNWGDPDFGMGHEQRWVPRVRGLMESGDSVRLERELMGLGWRTLCRANEAHYFDYEAVVLYVLRWNVIARWTGYDAGHALQRFQGLVDDGVGRFNNIFGREDE